MSGASSYIPPRRVRALIRRLGAELLVVNTPSSKVHCLNEVAGRIWLLCDGHNSVSQIAEVLTKERESQIDEDMVWLALKQLRKARLLQASPIFPEKISVARRKLFRTMGSAAALALPAVASIVVPIPAEAASCRPNLSPCTSNAQCCSGHCNFFFGGVCLPFSGAERR